MKKLFLFLVLAILILPIFSYADDDKESMQDIKHTDSAHGFTITYPSGCRAIKNYKGSALILFFPQKNIISPYAGHLNIIVKAVKPSARPLEEVVEIYYKYSRSVLEKKYVVINNIKFFSVVQMQRKFFTNFKLYTLIAVKGAKLYIITYTAPEKSYNIYYDKALRIINTFKLDK